MLERGDGGATQNLQRACFYFKLAADQNHPSGQYDLGYMYHHGVGVHVDLVEARRLYTLAAAQGVIAAMRGLSALRLGVDAGQHSLCKQYVKARTEIRRPLDRLNLPTI